MARDEVGAVPRRFRRGALVALIAAQAAASTGAGLSLTVASVTVLELSGSERVAGLAQTSIVVGASVLTLPVARLAVRSGRRLSLGTAYAVAAIGALVCAMGVALPAWPMVLLGLVLVGGGTVAGLAARFAAAETARRPRDAALAIALVLWASTVGSVVGPNLVSVTGLEEPIGAFALLAGLYGIAAAIVVAAIPGSLGRSGRVPRRASPRATLRVLRAHPAAALGLGITAAVHITMVALMAMAPVHLHHAMASPGTIGLVMSGHLAAMYALSPLFGIAVARWGGRPAGVASLVLAAAAAVVLAAGADGAAGAEVVFGVGLTTLGVAWSLGMISGSALIVGALDGEERLATQGATDLAINVGGGAASVVAGFVVAGAGYGALAVAFAVTLGIAVVATLATTRTRAEAEA